MRNLGKLKKHTVKKHFNIILYYQLTILKDKNTESRAFALEQFHEVNEAYNTLSKTHLKCIYDCKLMEEESLVELFKLI